MPRRPIPSPRFARLTVSRLLLVLLLAACAPAQKQAGVEKPARPAFALMGDTPYSEAESRRLDGLLDALNAEPLAFVAHVGDITSGRGPCTDAWFEARKAQLARLKA